MTTVNEPKKRRYTVPVTRIHWTVKERQTLRSLWNTHKPTNFNDVAAFDKLASELLNRSLGSIAGERSRQGLVNYKVVRRGSKAQQPELDLVAIPKTVSNVIATPFSTPKAEYAAPRNFGEPVDKTPVRPIVRSAQLAQEQNNIVVLAFNKRTLYKIAVGAIIALSFAAGYLTTALSPSV